MKKHNKNYLNWYERHILSTNFIEIFFLNETNLYLDNPKGFLWLKDEENIIYSKNKGRKIDALRAISVKRLEFLYLY